MMGRHSDRQTFIYKLNIETVSGLSAVKICTISFVSEASFRELGMQTVDPLSVGTPLCKLNIFMLALFSYCKTIL